MEMCRYPNKEDEGYKKISGELKLLLTEIDKRLEVQRRNREVIEAQARASSQANNGSPYCMHSHLSLSTPFTSSVDNEARLIKDMN